MDGCALGDHTSSLHRRFSSPKSGQEEDRSGLAVSAAFACRIDARVDVHGHAECPLKPAGIPLTASQSRPRLVGRQDFDRSSFRRRDNAGLGDRARRGDARLGDCARDRFARLGTESEIASLDSVTGSEVAPLDPATAKPARSDDDTATSRMRARRRDMVPPMRDSTDEPATTVTVAPRPVTRIVRPPLSPPTAQSAHRSRRSGT
jgi:hypothetical protein